MSSPGSVRELPSRDNLTHEKVSRRDFLTTSAIVASISAFAMSIVGLLKFPMPGLFPDVSNIYKIGKVEDFSVDSSKVISERNVMISRDAEGIYAISLVCTHLGCIVAPGESGFKCPCHGSVFDPVGNVIGGPAPKGLNWLNVSLSPTGKLLVDASKNVPAGTKFAV